MIFVPVTFPDEDYSSILHRLRHLDGRYYRNKSSEKLSLRDQKRTKSPEHQKIEELFTAASQQMQIFMWNHGLVPLKNNGFNAKKLGAPETAKAGLRKRKMCLLCIRGDILEFGVAYIHRSHNIPGITTCHKHNHYLSFECETCGVSHHVHRAGAYYTCGRVEETLVGETPSIGEYQFAIFSHRYLNRSSSEITESSHSVAVLVRAIELNLNSGTTLDKGAVLSFVNSKLAVLGSKGTFNDPVKTWPDNATNNLKILYVLFESFENYLNYTKSTMSFGIIPGDVEELEDRSPSFIDGCETDIISGVTVSKLMESGSSVSRRKIGYILSRLNAESERRALGEYKQVFDFQPKKPMPVWENKAYVLRSERDSGPLVHKAKSEHSFESVHHYHLRSIIWAAGSIAQSGCTLSQLSKCTKISAEALGLVIDYFGWRKSGGRIDLKNIPSCSLSLGVTKEWRVPPDFIRQLINERRLRREK